MKRIAAAAIACLWASAAMGQAKAKSPPAADESMMKKADDAKGSVAFTPRKVTHEDKKGIEALYAEQEAAWKKGDMSAISALVDFPVYMVTDDSKGTVYTDTWNKERYATEMTEATKNMPKDMKMKHARKYFFLTDDMAMVYDSTSMTMGKQKMSWNNAELVIKKNGKWMVKSMMEGGWGDMAKAKSTMSDTKG